MKRLSKILVFSTAAILAATPAFAHTGVGTHFGFASGFLHPLTGFDHMLAMLSVGIWSALIAGGSAKQSVWAAPLMFVIAMCAGAGMAFAGLAIPSVETGIAVSVMLLGLMVATQIRLGTVLGLGVIALFAVFHGHAHGSEAAGAIPAYMAGFTLATGLLHVAGIGLGLMIRDVRLAAPVLGSAMALVGAFMAAF